MCRLQRILGTQAVVNRAVIPRYTGVIQSFLESAEEFFMRGYQVHYYLFTQDPAAVPRVPLGPGRLLSIIPIQGYSQ